MSEALGEATSMEVVTKCLFPGLLIRVSHPVSSKSVAGIAVVVCSIRVLCF